MKENVVAHRLEPNGTVPNNPHCPLLVYPGAAGGSGGDLASHFEELFARNHWTGSWRNGIYPMHHWHNSAHEVLGIYSGNVTVQFGGEGGIELEAGLGDVIVVPAGVAHKRIDARGHLGVVGAYAGGLNPDLSTPGQATGGLARVIAAVPLPECDPVFGAGGPLFRYWR